MKNYAPLAALVAVVTVGAPATAATDPLSAVNGALKSKIVPEIMKTLSIREGDKLFMMDGNVKRRLMPGKPRGGEAEKAKKRQARKNSIAFSVTDEEAPDAIETVKIPKKMKAFFGPNGKSTPRSVSHRDQMTMVTNQGGRGTCGAFAITSALEALIGGGQKLSAEYMYWATLGRSAKKVCDDPGTDFEDAASALDRGGIPNDFYWVYTDLTNCPNADAPAGAKDHATIAPKNTYLFTRQTTGDEPRLSVSIDDPHFLEIALTAGYNMVIGVDAVWESADLKSGNVVDVKVDKDNKPINSSYKACKKSDDCGRVGGIEQSCEEGNDKKKRCTLGAHAMLVMGYERTGDEKSGGGYFTLKNSYGDDNDGKGYVKLSYDFIRAYANDGLLLTGSGKVPDGEACNDMAQCENFTAAGKKGSGCCKSDNAVKGVCEPLEKDWAGVFYCPDECVGRSGASPGTCPLVEDGGECKISADCKGFTAAGQPGSACCGGECQALQKDWANVFYCPDKCVGKAGGKPGSCSVGKAKGESCKTHADCDGFAGLGKAGNGCCNGSCASFKKDHAGVYYCKNECVGAAGASQGTCPLKGKNDSCKVSADCAKGRTCCSGKCKSKQTDWFGVKYCPDECVGSPGGKPGSCD